MKILHSIALAAALLGMSAGAFAGDGCPAGGDHKDGGCPGQAAGAEKGGCPGQTAGAEKAGGETGDGCCGGGAKQTVKIVELKTEELAKLVAEKKATIVDVNPAERYAKGHVPGAKNMKYDAVAAKDLPADKGAQLVFYCASPKCGACEVAAKKAVALGYTNVAVYRGGISGWEAAKQAVETTNPS